MEKFKEFCEVFSFYFLLYLSYIWEGILFLWNKLCGYIQEVVIPALPGAMKIFSNKIINRATFFVILTFILIINISSFIMFARDKRKAAKQKNRISEKKLFRVCFWGGSVGGFFGMLIFNHKTKKKRFYFLIPLLFIIQVVLESFLIGFFAFWGFFY